MTIQGTNNETDRNLTRTLAKAQWHGRYGLEAELQDRISRSQDAFTSAGTDRCLRSLRVSGIPRSRFVNHWFTPVAEFRTCRKRCLGVSVTRFVIPAKAGTVGGSGKEAWIPAPASAIRRSDVLIRHGSDGSRRNRSVLKPSSDSYFLNSDIFTGRPSWADRSAAKTTR